MINVLLCEIDCILKSDTCNFYHIIATGEPIQISFWHWNHPWLPLFPTVPDTSCLVKQLGAIAIKLLSVINFFSRKFLEGIKSVLWGYWYPRFWTSGDICPGFKGQVGSFICMLPHLHKMDSSESPLVRHLLTSWQPAWQPSLFDLLTFTYIHAHALVGCTYCIDKH